MANSREPYVEGHRIDTSVSTTVSDSKVKVYVGIEADTGTYDLTYQQTPKLFVQEYSTKSKPDTNDASTLLHAGKLVENFGIYVKRVNKDSILPGIVSTNKYGELGYFDTNFNLIKNLTNFKVSQNKKDITEQKLAIIIDNTVYINSNIHNKDDLDSAFDDDNKPYYYSASQTQVLINTTNFGINSDEGKPYYVLDGDNVLYTVICVGTVYNTDEFLNIVSEYAKNYRSDADKSEFIGYQPVSLMMSMDVSNWSNPSKINPIQACTTLKNSVRTTKALTKLEFTEGTESLLTNTLYNAGNNSRKYFDIGDFRYFPATESGTIIADSTVTPKKSTFASMTGDFDLETCTVSDAVISSIDTLIVDPDTVKPDSSYCSTEQVFKVKILREGAEGITLKPFYEVGEGSSKITQYSGFYGDGFEKAQNRLYIFTNNGNWVELKNATVASEFITQDGYAYIKIKFDGQINDVSGTTAGLKIFYSTVNQSGSEIVNTDHVLLYGKGVSAADIPTEFIDEGLDVDVVPILKDTTDLGIICGLSHSTFGNGNYGFEKQLVSESVQGYNIEVSVDDNGTTEDTTDDEVVVTKTPVGSPQTIPASVVNKLYLYFLNNRNVTVGVVGYDQKCWTKYATVIQKNYVFKSQEAISEGLPGYHAINVNKVIYYNGTKLSDVPDISELGEYDNAVPLATTKLTASEFISKLEVGLRNNSKLFAKLKDRSFLIGEVTKEDGELIEEDDVKVTSELKIEEFLNINQSQDFENARYAIIQRFTSAAPLFGINLTFDPTDAEILKFVNSYNGKEYTDKISFNVGKIDGYGTNISYKSYNLLDGRVFFVKVLNEEAPVIEMTVNSFGNDITPKKAESSDYVNALDDLVSDEFKPSFLWDAGLCNNSYTNALTALAEKTYSTVPISVPFYEDYSQIVPWKSVFNIDNPVQYILDGWHYNTVFGDISFECCPTYYYLMNILSNANTITKEFQPMFYKTRGIVSAGIPLRSVPLKKTEREKLLDLRINSIVRNKANSISYINQNFTNQQVESDFSEEQNVRISNEVCRSSDDYADNNIISKNNTETLRATVTSELTNILKKRILESRGDDTAKALYVECNDVNNTKDIIEARKLVIDVYVTYNKSVNAVLVYSRTKNLDEGK